VSHEPAPPLAQPTAHLQPTTGSQEPLGGEPGLLLQTPLVPVAHAPHVGQFQLPVLHVPQLE